MNQSWQSEPAGSISKTRAAGIALAITAVASKKNAAPVKVAGSAGETPNNRLLVNFCDAHAPNNPMPSAEAGHFYHSFQDKPENIDTARTHTESLLT